MTVTTCPCPRHSEPPSQTGDSACDLFFVLHCDHSWAVFGHDGEELAWGRLSRSPESHGDDDSIRGKPIVTAGVWGAESIVLLSLDNDSVCAVRLRRGAEGGLVGTQLWLACPWGQSSSKRGKEGANRGHRRVAQMVAFAAEEGKGRGTLMLAALLATCGHEGGSQTSARGVQPQRIYESTRGLV
jgi:hypothetical protein